MPSYTEEEKIKILYEQSLKDIREVVARIEGVSASIGNTARVLKAYEADANAKGAAALSQASAGVQQALDRLTGIEDGMQDAAARTAHRLLMGDGAPIPLLAQLVRRQNEALGWLNQAAAQYSNAYWQAAVVGVLAGVVGALIVRVS